MSRRLGARPNPTNRYRRNNLWDQNISDGVVGGYFPSSCRSVERLAKGYEILSVDEFEEGNLPRKLFRVTVRKE